jgi:hypothetical protein
MLVTSMLILLAVPIAGAANAYWGGLGSGGGSGTSGTALAVSLSPGTPGADLYPGGQANVMVNVSNPNSSPVHIGSLALASSQGTLGFAVDSGHSTCATSTLSFATQTNVGSGWTVPAKVGAVAGSLSVTLPNALAMGIDAAQTCQGASVTVYLAAGP